MGEFTGMTHHPGFNDRTRPGKVSVRRSALITDTPAINSRMLASIANRIGLRLGILE